MSSIDQGIKSISGLSSNGITASVLESHNPVILRGLVSEWPSVQAANKSAINVLGYLEKFSTDEPWTVFRGEPEIDGRVFYNADFTGFNYKVLGRTFKELISDLKQCFSQWCSLILYSSNFSMHSLKCQYDLWLLGGIVILGEF